MAPMELWRSEEMQLMQLVIPSEYAFEFVYALGETGMLQFKDVNADKTAFQRAYSTQVKKYEEMARKIRFLREQVLEGQIKLTLRDEYRKQLDADDLETKLEEVEYELIELNANAERLNRSQNELLELQLVIEKAGAFFQDAQAAASSVTTAESVSTPLLDGEQKGSRLGFVAGTIPMEKVNAFQRLLFRATRGNMYLQYTPVGKVTDPATAEKQEKAVFVVFFSGERARTKLLKICEAFGANRYPLPDEPAKQRAMNSEVSGRLRELSTTIETGERYRTGVLQELAANVEAWSVQVAREKAVYHTLNKLSVDASSKVLVGEAWCPVAGKARVLDAMREASTRVSAHVTPIFHPIKAKESPPTYFACNEFQQEFQNIVESYGVAAYQEVNPTVYSIITFPFLFAIMFGDVGHGTIMLAAALFMVFNEKKLGKQDLGDIFGMLFGGRYVILFMALFSIYTGLLYNECFSLPLSFFSTQRWACPGDYGNTDIVQMKFHPDDCPLAFTLGLEKVPGDPYPFGVDPGWKGSSTELMFLNSIKMKLSILIGVAQMNLGVVCSFFNHLYFKDTLSMICEFVPQMIFLNAMFGYLCLLMVLKWVTGSTADLYHILIYMFLDPGNADCNGTCPENILIPGQGMLQAVLLVLMFVSVPWMLIPKPLVLKARAEAKQKHHYQALTDEEMMPVGKDLEQQEEEEEEFEFGEIMVHQMIHTIEFVLGAVSNTASYLRLWALSLAHSQLSAVFYDRVMISGIQAGPVGIFIALFVFFCATMGVLMLMESLSAFLHALRLHWVEYMNKFYAGDGYPFMPFSFQELDKEAL